MHIFFSVGEPSGDLHASKLVEALRRRLGPVECSGFGGPLMEAAGVRVLYPLTNLALMGVLEVLPLLWRFLRLLRQAREFLEAHRPDAVVLVDYPGFNWWIARCAKRLKIPVYYYMPPQLWAWAPWRIHKVRRLIDHILCGLPFEEAWYRERGVSVECVGHPFFDEVRQRPLDKAFLSRIAGTRAEGGAVVGVLPGSRNAEVHLNFPIQLQIMQRLAARHPQTRFLVASYKQSQVEECQRMLAESPENCYSRLHVELHVGRTAEIIEASDACLMVSGSVSLELLARRTPAVVLYRASGWIHYLLARMLVTCRFISLPNLIAGEEMMPEYPFRGDGAREIEEMSRIVDGWLSEPAALEREVARLDRVAQQIAQPGATDRAAACLAQRLIPLRAVKAA
jgi:lipid-A-disaccharide synthase